MKNEVVIDGAEYIMKGTVNAKPTKKQIIVIDGGHVAVGDVASDGGMVSVKNACIIRTWGTSMGLGEIAINGPTNKTVLDKCQDLFIPIVRIIFFMNLDVSKW